VLVTGDGHAASGGQANAASVDRLEHHATRDHRTKRRRPRWSLASLDPGRDLDAEPVIETGIVSRLPRQPALVVAVIRAVVGDSRLTVSEWLS